VCWHDAMELWLATLPGASPPASPDGSLATAREAYPTVFAVHAAADVVAGARLRAPLPPDLPPGPHRAALYVVPHAELDEARRRRRLAAVRAGEPPPGPDEAVGLADLGRPPDQWIRFDVAGPDGACSEGGDHGSWGRGGGDGRGGAADFVEGEAESVWMERGLAYVGGGRGDDARGGDGDVGGDDGDNEMGSVARELWRLQWPAACSAATALAVIPPRHLGRSGWGHGPAAVAAGLLSFAHNLGRALVVVHGRAAGAGLGETAVDGTVGVWESVAGACDSTDVEGVLDLSNECPGDGPPLENGTDGGEDGSGLSCSAELEAALEGIPRRHRWRGLAWWRRAVARYVSAAGRGHGTRLQGAR
jgi:hypothetical protein